MLRVFRKAHHFVSDRGAVSRPDTFDFTRIHRRKAQILSNDFVRLLVGISDPARNLFHVEHSVPPTIKGKRLVDGVKILFPVGEKGRRGITILAFASAEIDRATIEPGWRGVFETAHIEPEFPEIIAQGGKRISHTSAALYLLSNMEQPAHESAGGNHEAPTTDGET